MKTDVKFDINHWVWDLETYKSVFTFGIVRADCKHLKIMEVSERKDDTEIILNCLRWLINNNQSLVGFNSIGFDYPILHQVILDAKLAKKRKTPFKITAKYVYDLAQRQIDSFKGDFGNTIKAKDEFIRQIDLYKIHHFDNKAKSTSLKMIEFNMRSETIEDLPFSPHATLTVDQIEKVVSYNEHDILKTLDFYHESYPLIEFREQLSEEYGVDFTNHNDTKIGKDYFISVLEKKKPGSCYKIVGDKKVINRTVRKQIVIKDCLFDYYDFKRPEFVAIKDWFSKQVITETKGVFSDIPEHLLFDVSKYAKLEVKKISLKGEPDGEVFKQLKKDFPLGWLEEQELKATQNVLDEKGNTVKVLNEKGRLVNLKEPKKSYWYCYKYASSLNVLLDGFEIVFGVGGIHASVASSVVEADTEEMIVDADVSSMYPNIAISNEIYPLHLSKDFCEVYSDVYEQRKKYPKGSPKNAAMKLALNGVYGDSNNQYSPFFDSKYTMQVTINGQLSLCLLGEKLLEAIPDIKFIQWNTDGITVKINKKDIDKYKVVCNNWEKQVKLQLEFAEYSKMFIRDVNNYIAVYVDGKLKRKGAYEYENLGWHQNQSCLVVPKAVEANLVHAKDIRQFIENHKDVYDFMLRTKVPRSSKLVLEFEDGASKVLQNICRYYPCTNGGKLIKIMPPLAGKEEQGERRLGIDTSWNVIPCNDMKDFSGNINYDYYVEQAQKLASLKTTDEVLQGEDDAKDTE